jgi:hypothetical protein
MAARRSLRRPTLAANRPLTSIILGPPSPCRIQTRSGREPPRPRAARRRTIDHVAFIDQHADTAGRVAPVVRATGWSAACISAPSLSNGRSAAGLTSSSLK